MMEHIISIAPPNITIFIIRDLYNEYYNIHYNVY